MERLGVRGEDRREDERRGKERMAGQQRTNQQRDERRGQKGEAWNVGGAEVVDFVTLVLGKARL